MLQRSPRLLPVPEVQKDFDRPTPTELSLTPSQIVVATPDRIGYDVILREVCHIDAHVIAQYNAASANPDCSLKDFPQGAYPEYPVSATNQDFDFWKSRSIPDYTAYVLQTDESGRVIGYALIHLRAQTYNRASASPEVSENLGGLVRGTCGDDVPEDIGLAVLYKVCVDPTLVPLDKIPEVRAALALEAVNYAFYKDHKLVMFDVSSSDPSSRNRNDCCCAELEMAERAGFAGRLLTDEGTSGAVHYFAARAGVSITPQIDVSNARDRIEVRLS